MAEQHDPIAFFRHVLRAGDVALARRLGRLLMADPRYRDLALAELAALGAPGSAGSTPAGAALTRLSSRLLGENGA
jgi:hypothetical protein